MKTIVKSLIIYLAFFIGMSAVIHVDRTGAQLYCENPQIMETVENTIEKYASLL